MRKEDYINIVNYNIYDNIFRNLEVIRKIHDMNEQNNLFERSFYTRFKLDE